MRDQAELQTVLGRIDGRGYKAYRDIEGAWSYPDFELRVDHVQSDPFAAPSRLRVVLDPEIVRLPADAYRSHSRALGVAARLARTFAEAGRTGSRRRGSGRSGEIRMEHPGQEVLPQTAVIVGGDGAVEARFTVGLPADGRRVAGGHATELLLDDVPGVVRSALLASAHGPGEIERAAAANEDATTLREALDALGLLAFVGDGARLPRRSGIDDRPLHDAVSVPFRSPAAFRVEVDLPNAGAVTGMGVPTGVTLIVGGGFHGKSTLLRALESGVYNHRPGDGRELVVTRSDAVKIRAEDGRSVVGVDISDFIDGLPFGRDTASFSTQNASGSTSQAAAIVEALEAGAGAVLVDEDTSATNFMIRDRRMQELVPKSGEPITPFVDRIRDLYERRGVSSVLVIGGSGDYLDVADHVVCMVGYLPDDVSERARDVALRLPTGRRPETTEPLRPALPRRLAPASIDPSKGRRASYVRVPDDRTLLFGAESIDLVAVEQLASRAQTRAIGRALVYVAEQVLRDSSATVNETLHAVEEAVAERGLDVLDGRLVGDLAAFRRFELAAALNRLRTLCVV